MEGNGNDDTISELVGPLYSLLRSLELMRKAEGAQNLYALDPSETVRRME